MKGDVFDSLTWGFAPCGMKGPSKFQFGVVFNITSLLPLPVSVFSLIFQDIWDIMPPNMFPLWKDVREGGRKFHGLFLGPQMSWILTHITLPVSTSYEI